MRKGGFLVGVPLTLLQCGVSPHLPFDPSLVCCNFLLGHAIYDADRMEGGVWDKERLTTRVAAFASTSILLSHPGTVPVSPLVPFLHLGYTPLKPVYLSPVKPFFVSSMWTLLVCYVPPLFEGTSPAPDVCTVASVFLSLSSLSHALDVVDITEDEKEGVVTPAVRMGMREAKAYLVALSLATCVVYPLSPLHSEFLQLLFLSSVTGAYFESLTLSRSLLVLTMVGSLLTHQVEVIQFLLRSTEITHKIAIERTLEIVEWGRELPSPWKERVIEGTVSSFKFGDWVGSTLLRLYESALRGEM